MAKNQTKETVETVEAVFRDKRFKSRVIVLEDGRSFAVEKGTIKTSDTALIEHLSAREDFEREAV